MIEQTVDGSAVFFGLFVGLPFSGADAGADDQAIRAAPDFMDVSGTKKIVKGALLKKVCANKSSVSDQAGSGHSELHYSIRA